MNKTDIHKKIKTVIKILLLFIFIGITAFAYAANAEGLIFGSHNLVILPVLSSCLFTAMVLLLLCAPARFRKTPLDITMLLYCVSLSVGSLLLIANKLGLHLPESFSIPYVFIFATPYYGLLNIIDLLHPFFQEDALRCTQFAVMAIIGILGIVFTVRCLHTNRKNKTDSLSESPAKETAA